MVEHALANVSGFLTPPPFIPDTCRNKLLINKRRCSLALILLKFSAKAGGRGVIWGYSEAGLASALRGRCWVEPAAGC